MPRRKCKRRIGYMPEQLLFKPAGIPTRQLEIIALEDDELEAIRLADYKSLYHEDAAKKMGISRQTFGRILQQARYKMSASVIEKKAIKIGSGNKIDEGNMADLL